ncbi:MAG: thioredoxin [Chitinophagales bacterium]|nr:MAG: thioredoxin [Chitinophagales bacterium]
MSTSYEVKDFDKEVTEHSHTVPVVVDFWAPWCGPCQALGPILENLAAKSNGSWKLVKVNVDEHPDLATRFRVRSIPMVLLFKGGKPADSFTGAVPVSWLEKWLTKHIPSDNDKKTGNAIALLKAGKTDEAEKLLKEVLETEPTHAQASITLAELLLFRQPEKAREMVSHILEDNEAFLKADAIRTISTLLQLYRHPEKLEEDPVKPIFLKGLQHLADQQFGEAAEQFIEVILQNKAYQDEAARKAAIAIFNLLGRDHEVTRTYRRRFDMSLY